MSYDVKAAIVGAAFILSVVGLVSSMSGGLVGDRTYVWIADPGDCKIETNGVEYRVVTLTESGEWRPLQIPGYDVNIFRDIYSARRYMAENRPRHEWR